MPIINDINAINNDQGLGVYRLTPDGKKAERSALSLMTESVVTHSNRLAEDAAVFADGLKSEMDQLETLRNQVHALAGQIEGNSALDNAAVDELFAVESELNLLAQSVFAKSARIEAMVADLEDPVTALDRIEAKYPVIGKNYLEPFGR